MKNFEGLTPAQLEAIENMKKANGQLMVWPADLTGKELLDLENRRIIFHVNWGPNTYGHTSWHLNQGH